ncbi:MAG: hypothetical protein GY720_17370 [bacterium]|nr:hypothetical protein [bacterium]
MLRFFLGSIPASIHFSFLVVLYFAYQYTGDFVDAVIASAGVLIAILIHETGHALTARRFGARNVKITLFALGGVTTYTPPQGLTAGRRFLIAAAGSALAITVALPVFLGLRSDLISGDPLELLSVAFVYAGLGWGLLNWVPIRPLDGGQMLTAGLQLVMPERGAIVAKVISAIVTVVAVVLIYQNYGQLFAVYVGIIGFIGLRDDPGQPAGPDPGIEPPEGRPQAAADQEPPPAFPL